MVCIGRRWVACLRSKKGTRWIWIRGRLLHEDGHQQGVAVGYTRQGLKPCHRPLIAALAESKLIANYWLRRGDSRLRQWGGGVFASDGARLARAHSDQAGARRRGFWRGQRAGHGPGAGFEIHFCGASDAESAKPLPA